MELSIAKPELIAALSAVIGCIDARAVMPQLACVRIAAGESAVFETTNLIESSRCKSAALVMDEGSALLPAKMLQSIAKSLPDTAVAIRSEKGHATIGAGGAVFDIPALDPKEFPCFPEVSRELTVTIDAEDFSKAVKRVTPFVMRGEKSGNSCLRGVHVYVSGGSLRFDATDSYKMCRCCVMRGLDVEFDAVVPVSMIGSASSSDEGDVTIGIGGNQVSVSSGSVTFVSRTIEGSYPKIDAFFQAAGRVGVSINRESVLGVLKRASALDGGKSPVLIEFSPDGGTVSYSLADGGSMCEGIECECEVGCSIYANIRFMHDALSSVDSDSVSIMVLEGKPIILDGEDVHAVVMPMTRKRGQ